MRLMADEPIAARCHECHEEWRHDVNMLTGKPVWLRPKVKRAKGSCTHQQLPEVLVENVEGGVDWVRVTSQDT
jgi:hypothetical protein